jgi:hypothetical protein
MSIAWLETPGVGYPSRKGATAEIRILDGEFGNFHLSGFRIQALLAPFDWGPGGKSLVFTSVSGALSQAWLDQPYRVEQIAPKGTLPRFCPGGERLAYYADSAIMVRQGTEVNRFPVQSPVIQLCWALNEPTIWFAEVVGPWRTQVSALDLGNQRVTPVFQTGVLSTLDMIARLPSWSEFGNPIPPTTCSGNPLGTDAQVKFGTARNP